MSRTDIDAATLANYLRQMCGDGSVEWSYEPMQTSVLLDVADMLDENARLQKELAGAPRCETCDAMLDCDECQRADESHKERRRLSAENAKLREIIADLEELLPESERRYSHETVKAISENNAKLRKLLLDVWNDACEFDGFWDYVHDDGKIYREDELPHYQERMRELGVEL